MNEEKLKEEMVDVLDEEGNVTGETASLLEVHEKGLWHQTAHVWIWDGEGKILLQKRAEGKMICPGFWDVSAAGHIDAGEEVEDGALRETEEELGVKFGKEDLVKLGVSQTDGAIPKTEWWDKEWQHIWLAKWEGKMEDLKMEEDEVCELKWASLEEFEEMAQDPEKAKLVPHEKEFEMLLDFLKKENE